MLSPTVPWFLDTLKYFWFVFCIAGGVSALKTCFALHFTAEMWRVRIKGMLNITFVMFLLALLTKGSSKIMQQYLVQKSQ